MLALEKDDYKLIFVKLFFDKVFSNNPSTPLFVTALIIDLKKRVFTAFSTFCIFKYSNYSGISLILKSLNLLIAASCEITINILFTQYF